MIDVNKITSTLAKLPDAQLQQYAQMHKSDPYIMALAMSESNRRKEMRAAGQGAKGMQEQPKVVDQMVAEMAPQQQAQPMPEDQGIGQLPAGDMNFASGGIIAFADGGDVERYQAGGSIQDRYRQESIEMGMGTRMQYSPEVRTFAQAQEQASREGYADRERARMLQGPYGGMTQATAAPAADAPAAPRVTPTFSADDLSGMDRRLMTGSQQPTIQSISPPAKPPVAAPPADTTKRSLSGAPATKPAAPTQTAAQRYADMQKGLNPERENINQGIAALGTSMRTAAKGELEDFDKDVAERGVAAKGREDRLAKREEGLSKRKDENMGLSLLEAGLAIMSTPGSLATAIGKGAQVGLKTYGTGLKDLRAAQEKMDDARDQLEEFRRNEANMTAKERRQFKSAINRTETDIEKLSLSAAEKMYGYGREDAKTVFTADTQERLTGMEIGSREKIARLDRDATNTRAAGQNRNTQLELLKALQDDPKLMTAYRTMQGKSEDVMGQYNDYLKANPTLALDPKAAFTQFLMTKSAFQQLGTPTVTDKPTGPVRN